MLREDSKWSFKSAPISDHRINEELEFLAHSVGSELNGRFTFGIFADSPTIDFRRKGFNCRIEGQMVATSDGKGITVSCHVLLPKRVDYRLYMERIESSHLFRQVRSGAEGMLLDHNIPAPILQRIMPPELLNALCCSGLSFSLTLLGDRLSIKVYGAHKHGLYLALLDVLIAASAELIAGTG